MIKKNKKFRSMTYNQDDLTRSLRVNSDRGSKCVLMDHFITQKALFRVERLPRDAKIVSRE